MTSLVRRRGRLLCAGLAAGVALAVAPFAATAQAEDPPGVIDATLIAPNTLAGSGSPGKAAQFALELDNLQTATMVANLSDLDGLVTVEVVADGCSAAALVVTCDLSALGDGLFLFVPFVLHPTSGATAGESGQITWRTFGTNVDPQTRSATITIADGVDLVVTSGGKVFNHVQPGHSVAVPIAGANAGNQSTSVLLLVVIGFQRVTFAEYDNCEYFDDLGSPIAFCEVVIDGGLDPGDGFEIVDGFDVKANADAWREDVEYLVVPGDDVPSELASKLRKGSGPKLRARPLSKPSPQAADIDDADNFGRASLVVDNTADRAAQGASAHGDADEVVSVAIGVKNLGPAYLLNRAGEASSRYKFVVPTGTTVVEVPDGCVTPDTVDDPAAPGLPEYWCNGPILIEGGEAYGHTFKLKITQSAESTGSVEVLTITRTSPLPPDTNAANDKAAVVINGVTGGGGLPDTGDRTGLIAGIGGGVLVVGAILFVLGRRRRSST